MFISCDRAFNVTKVKGMGKEGFRVRVLVKTVYYIVTKVRNFKKKKSSKCKKNNSLHNPKLRFFFNIYIINII